MYVFFYLISIGVLLLLPLGLAQIGRPVGGRRVVWPMIAAGAVAGGWMLLGGGSSWLGIEAIYPGLVVSAVGFAWLARRGRARDPVGGRVLPRPGPARCHPIPAG